MQHVARYGTERAQVVCNLLISFNAQVLPRFAAQVAQVARNALILNMPRFCPGVPHYSPYNPHTGCTRFTAVQTRNEVMQKGRLPLCVSLSPRSPSTSPAGSRTIPRQQSEVR